MYWPIVLQRPDNNLSMSTVVMCPFCVLQYTSIMLNLLHHKTIIIIALLMYVCVCVCNYTL